MSGSDGAPLDQGVSGHTEPPLAPRRSLAARLSSHGARWGAAARPSPVFWRGATRGVLAVLAVYWGATTWELLTPASTALPLLISGAFLGVGLVALVVVLGLLRFLQGVPWGYRWALVGTALLLATMKLLAPFGGMWTAAAVAYVLLTATLAGGAAAVLYSGQWRLASRWSRGAMLLSLVAGVGGLLGLASWLALPGPPLVMPINAATSAEANVPPLALADPSQRGPFEVLTLTYGSGGDRYRTEFASGAVIKTQGVDASHLLQGWDGFSGWVRTWYWGFDQRALPLNGRVWHPQGDGPFPLVLVVHGNHGATDFSDSGYQFLGELLASRGYIVVSVDENFLNSMETDLLGELEDENNARGWLLLEHLRLWHEWNVEPGSLFHGRVDLGRIALIGHSRGGEAIVHAALFNRLPRNPDDGRKAFAHGYQIRSLLAIAPVDGQYRPAGALARLEDVNYLVVHGSQDGDVSTFLGLQTYDRIRFSRDGGWFKTSVYVYGANHGQFNTTWGAHDFGVGLPRKVLNTRALLPPDRQRRVLEVYASAFLEATLRDACEYRRLFQDWRAGAAWLPETIYLGQFADSSQTTLAEFDEDLNLDTVGLAGGAVEAAHLAVWREAVWPRRRDRGDDRCVVLGWDRQRTPEPASYELRWPVGTVTPGADDVLSFSLADANEELPDDDAAAGQDLAEAPRDAAEKTDDEPRLPLNLSLEVRDEAGQVARLPLAHCALLQPQLETRYLKAAFLHQDALSEAVPQTFRLRLADFQQANPRFDPRSMVAVRFVFDQTEQGVVLLDKVALGR